MQLTNLTNQITIATSTKKNIPQYNLTITIQPKSGKPQTISMSRPFAEWFDAAGHLVAPPLQTMLATAIPAVGRLDPKRVVSQSQSYTPDMLDALAAATSTGSETPQAEAGGKKGGKRRKA